jgi:O-antigen ligase
MIFEGGNYDGAIGARFEAFTAGFNLFIQNSILGAGFGGFNFGDGINTQIKYPHNVFIEILSETGIVGMICITVMFYFAVRRMKDEGRKFLWIWLFGIWLALFSKDLSTNPIVYLPFAFAGAKRMEAEGIIL